MVAILDEIRLYPIKNSADTDAMSAKISSMIKPVAIIQTKDAPSTPWKSGTSETSEQTIQHELNFESHLFSALTTCSSYLAQSSPAYPEVVCYSIGWLLEYVCENPGVPVPFENLPPFAQKTKFWNYPHFNNQKLPAPPGLVASSDPARIAQIEAALEPIITMLKELALKTKNSHLDQLIAQWRVDDDEMVKKSYLRFKGEKVNAIGDVFQRRLVRTWMLLRR